MSILSLKNVSFQDANTKVLKDINLEINEGDFITITGPSGGGKSTLLRLLGDLISPTSGHIFLRGKDFSEIPPLNLRTEINYFFQQPYLFGNTVYDNLSFPYEIRKKNIDENKIYMLLEKFNMGKDYLDKDINKLSGGEKQRISLIRSLLHAGPILLLDEITSALDKENKLLVEHIMKDMNKEGHTILWITHDISQIMELSNKKIIIEDGTIISKEGF
ncbi:ATP-binding cassette domain-containing protein [Clostridium sp.]|uniref:ABC transporter ATP-binding protein n=1 Tax=Clostridium sp. TaxID=1506 RepID=UPI003217385B